MPRLSALWRVSDEDPGGFGVPVVVKLDDAEVGQRVREHLVRSELSRCGDGLLDEWPCVLEIAALEHPQRAVVEHGVDGELVP
jgi:hypothetical protein